MSLSVPPVAIPRGRPTTATPEALALLCHLIRAHGLSDSAAAQAAGLSTSSLSRWKQADPQLTLRLLQARQEFRLAQLEVIRAAAQAPRGWRAAAWLLERIFPEDYSPRAKERVQFQELAALPEPAPHLEPAPEEDPAPAAEPSAPVGATSVPPSQNSRNSPPDLPALARARALRHGVPVPPSGPLLPAAA